jgi:hypothetical protein
MRNTITLFLAFTTAALGCLCVFQWQKLSRQQAQLVSERAEEAASSNQIAALESVQKQLEEQRDQLRHETEDLSGQLLAQQPAEATPALASQTNAPAENESAKADTNTTGFGKVLGKMMQDPNMKKFLADQQRVMADLLYSPLIRQMGLTPDEAAKFKELVTEPMMNAAEQTASLFDGSSSNRTATLNSISEQQKNLDEQLKSLLGDARYAQYKDYQQSSGERMQLNLFKQQNAGSDNPVTDAQTEQLLSFIKEEKANVASTTGEPVLNSQDPASRLKNLQALMSDEQLDKFLQSQETLHQRVFERARTILSPDQLDAFGKFQSSQSSMMRMGMSMARKMFAPGNTDAGDATLPP